MNALMANNLSKVIELLEYNFKLNKETRPDLAEGDKVKVFLMAEDVVKLDIKPNELHKLLDLIVSKTEDAELIDIFEYNDYSLGVLELEIPFNGEERPFATILLPKNCKNLKSIVPENNSGINLETLKNRSIAFDDNKSSLFVDGYQCSLPPFKNEQSFCRVMFGYPVNTPVDGSEVFQKMNDFMTSEDRKSVV